MNFINDVNVSCGRWLQGFETMLKARFGIAWDEWKHGAKTSIAYMDFMGKLWEGIKVSYSTEESQEQDQHLHQLELPQSLGKLLDKNTKKWVVSESTCLGLTVFKIQMQRQTCKVAILMMFCSVVLMKFTCTHEIHARYTNTLVSLAKMDSWEDTGLDSEHNFSRKRSVYKMVAE